MKIRTLKKWLGNCDLCSWLKGSDDVEKIEHYIDDYYRVRSYKRWNTLQSFRRAKFRWRKAVRKRNPDELPF